ncbi:MAG: hypothetical protein ABW047_06125 [Nitrospiraceae bacterium]
MSTTYACAQCRAGWIAYPAGGRAEEELGTPVFVTKDLDAWLASVLTVLGQTHP